MKTPLTNLFTKVFFTLYGDNCLVEYNGNKEQAKDYVKRNYGVKKINFIDQYKRDCFLPIGYSSFEKL